LLFRQSASDPVVFVEVSGTMIVVALIAGAVPAIRAARADPITALRSE
jgi:ABC-type antimicrobial peptide transport system permease subunit